jgi:ubiquinone/menaquinone biosynthesis C-methylase UbiE
MDEGAAMNYASHEEIYRQLKSDGAEGWGAASFHTRMEGWSRTISWALNHVFFPPAPAKILDLGCGAGDSALPLAQLGYSISGVDISQTAVEWAKEKFSTNSLPGDFRSADITDELPWADQSFSAVLDSATLHCILGEDRAQTFAEIKRVLKPCGVLLLSSMVGEPKLVQNLEFFDPVNRIQKVQGLPMRYAPDLADLKNELLKYKFQILADSITHNPWWDHYTAILSI